MLELSLKGVDPLVSRELHQYCDFEPKRSIDENFDAMDNDEIPEDITDPTDVDAFLESSIGRGRSKRERNGVDDKRSKDDDKVKTPEPRETSPKVDESVNPKLDNV